MRHYEIHYTLQGQSHTDVINSLDVPVIDVAKGLARKNNVPVNDAILVDDDTVTLPHISEVSVSPLDD